MRRYHIHHQEVLVPHYKLVILHDCDVVCLGGVVNSVESRSRERKGEGRGRKRRDFEFLIHYV